MSCTSNLTADQLRNRISSGIPFWDITSDMTVDDIVDTFDFIQNNMILKDDIGEEGKTFYDIAGHRVKHRTSDLAKTSARQRMDQFTRENIDKWKDPQMKAQAGTKLHTIMQLLVDLKYNKKGNIADIKKLALTGPFALSSRQLENLSSMASFIIMEIEKTQETIDPTKKAIILTEQKVYDPHSDRGGTMDLFAIYSDKTGGIFDYKSKSSWEGNYRNNELIDNLMSPQIIGDYELNMTEYKRIVMQRHGIKAIRQNRLVPIHIRLKVLPKELQGDHAVLSDQIDTLEAGEFTNDFLQMIPVAGEATKYNGINKVLEKQWALFNTLNEKLKKARTAEESDRLRGTIANLRQSIQNTIIKSDISDLIVNMSMLNNDARQKLAEPKTLPDGSDNPRYLSGEELESLIHELSVYENIIDSTNVFFQDMEAKHHVLFKEMKAKLFNLSPHVFSTLSTLRQEREHRILELVPDEYKSSPDVLSALPDLDFISANFGRISEINHPLFKVAWKIIQKSINKVRHNSIELDKEIDEVTKELFQWAKAQGISRQEAFNKLINFENSSLHNNIKQELLDKINNAYRMAQLEDAKYLQSVFEIKDVKGFKEQYANRLERQKDRYKLMAEENPIKAKKDIENWIAKNDLLNSNEAWLNSRNRWRLKIKDSVVENNLSDEYKYIKENKPLLAFYDMYKKYNNEFRKILNIDKYSQLPDTFIPNVRKEMIEHITSRTSSFGGAIGEFVDSFRVREEDVFMADIDESGEVRRNIPMLYLNPLRNKNNEIDNTQKSYDLSKSLFLFGKMAYNYQAMLEIEPDILALKAVLGDASSEQEGTLVTSKTGRKIKGKIKEYATKKGLGTDAYKLFEDFADYYLYGIKFKEKSLSSSINTTKLLTSLKQYHSKRSLGFALIPAMGAFIAGKAGTVFEANKGISYTKTTLKDAQVNAVTDTKKYIALSKFFDIYAEDPLDRMAQARTTNWVNKVFNSRVLFAGLRKADENITNLVINAMALNFGIDPKGNLIRLNRSGKNIPEGTKSIYDLFKINEKDGTAELNISEDTYLSFRRAGKDTMAKIIGSLSQEDISKVDTNLLINLMMHYKSWMPGLVKERFGKLHYNEDLQAAVWGRYNAAFSEMKMTKEERLAGYQFGTFFKDIVLPNAGKAIIDLMTFGLAPKLGLGYMYGDTKEDMRRIRSNPKRAYRRYQEWITENPHLQGKATFEEFLEAKEAQMKTALMELRTILMFMGFLMFLGADGDDGEARYMDNWMTRTLYKTLAKGNSELMFLWNPNEFIGMISNPIPLTAMLSDVIATGKNTFDETKTLLTGEKDPYDKTPMFYYSIQWAYGGAQLARFFEFYEQNKKSIY